MACWKKSGFAWRITMYNELLLTYTGRLIIPWVGTSELVNIARLGSVGSFADFLSMAD